MDASGYVANWYAYVPEKAPAVAATALFVLTFIAHTWQMIRHKAWIWFVMVVAVASTFKVLALVSHLLQATDMNAVEVFGYGIRIASAKDTSKKPPFVAQYVLIVLAPVLMTGIIYVAFGRIVFHVIPAANRSMKLLWVSRKYANIPSKDHPRIVRGCNN